MKTERKILVAFVLNLAFSIFEFFGGMITGSVAILSDAIHDLGDAASIGISYALEKKSNKQPDNTHTYGYARYSVMGGCITTLILLVGCITMIYQAITRMITPTPIRYNGMILFAVVGVCVNFCAAVFTRDGHSLNQKAVNLHMLEDVLGWLVVLVGAIVMRFTDFALLDPLMSIGVAVFILIQLTKNLKEIVDLFLVKTPHSLDVAQIKAQIGEIYGVQDVHHIHLWSLDGQSHYATMHIVTNGQPQAIKRSVRERLLEQGIGHVTIELETSAEHCREKECRMQIQTHSHHCHH